MSSTASSPKRIEKVSSDNIVISFDLLSNLTFMATLAAAQLPREKILQRAGEQRGLKTSVFFQQVHLLAQRLGVEYTRALQLVAEKARAPNAKSLLLRFSNTIASGESEHAFLREESRIAGGRYASEYERSVENLKKWTEAYAALMVSVTLIVVVALVSTLLGALDQSFIVIVGVTMFMITSAGVFIILRTAPYEQLTYDGVTLGPSDRARARKLLRVLGPIGAILGSVLLITLGLGPALIAVGLCLLPTGYFARRDDREVHQIDEEVPTFIRSLGNIASSTGSTLSAALNNLDTAPLVRLRPHIGRLRTRLSNRLLTDLSWERFQADVGNELLRRSTEMLVVGVELGADGEEVGNIASSYSTRVMELREIRGLTASSFSVLVIPMHVAMTGLLLFVLQIVVSFEELLGDVSGGISGEEVTQGSSGGAVPGIDLFQGQDLTLVAGMITMVILILTVANGLAPKFAAGGHSLKIAFSLGITSLISGINVVVVPVLAGGLMTTG